MGILRRRSIILGLLGGAILMLMWQLAAAQAPSPIGHPAQNQLRQILLSLKASEAEHALGGYVPGVGAVVNMELVRGPNSLADKTPYVGTHDWMIYLMQTFGPQLTEVPPNETIALSVDYFDYNDRLWHQLIVKSSPADVANVAAYQIWLDGIPYAEALARLGVAPAANGIPLPAESPLATSEPPALSPMPSPLVSAPALASGPITATLDFVNPEAAAQDWDPLGGTWVFTDSAYVQTELNRFDLISFFRTPLSDDFRLEAQIRYIEGNMGGGLVFNAPTDSSKAGAHMVSYTADGTYLQWGYFDAGGIFQFQGGSQVSTGSDKQPHQLAIQVTDETYSVTLDGTILAQNVPLMSEPGGYAGLIVSTSRVAFDTVKIESGQQ